MKPMRKSLDDQIAAHVLLILQEVEPCSPTGALSIQTTAEVAAELAGCGKALALKVIRRLSGDGRIRQVGEYVSINKNSTQTGQALNLCGTKSEATILSAA